MVNWPDADVFRKTIRRINQAVWIQNTIALCLIVESCNGNQFIGPINTTVAEGTRATLSCQTSSSKTVWWKYQQHDVFYANTIAHAYKSSHEAYVDASKGIYNLIILNASSHAGLYTCVDDDGEGESRSAWLTVTTIGPPAENNTPNTVAIVVGTLVPVCLAIIIIVIVLVFFCKRRPERCQHKASEDVPKSTVAKKEEKEYLMNTRSQLEEQTIPDNDENTPEHHEETREDRIKDHIVSTETRQNSTTAGVKEIEEPTTSSDVANKSQIASSVSSTQEDTLKKSIDDTSNPSESGQVNPEISQRRTGGRAMEGPVAKPRMSNEQETPLASTTPEEKEESGNDNVNTTEPKSTIESTNTTDNTQTDPLKPDTHEDERSEVLPESATTTKICESNVAPIENSPKNGAIASPGKQDSVAKEKPKITRPKPKLTSVSSNVPTEHTTKDDGISRESNVKQGKDDSNPKHPEEVIPQQQDKERDLSKELLTGDDDKKEISFKSEHIG